MFAVVVVGMALAANAAVSASINAGVESCKTNPSLPPSFKLKAGPLDLVLEEIKSLGGGGCVLVVGLIPLCEA